MKLRHAWMMAVALLWAATPGSIAATDSAVAVIVNAANPVADLSLSQLALMYQGKVKTWSNGEEVVPVNRSVDSPERAIFYKRVLRSKPTQKFFIEGSPIPVTIVVQPSGLAVTRFVARAPGAVGYVLLSDLHGNEDGVKVISVDGAPPPRGQASSTEYKLQ
ncbi:MAG: substrate-binding domain-containing protein [Nitrospirae bacterium]|nr:substrate-binding domain-containing protein [Nitrospirota bacterium]